MIRRNPNTDQDELFIISTDEEIFHGANWANKIERIDLATGTLIETIRNDSFSLPQFQDLAFDEDGRLFITALEGSFAGADVGVYRLDPIGDRYGEGLPFGLAPTPQKLLEDDENLNITIGPDGLLYVTNFSTGLTRYNADSGTIVDSPGKFQVVLDDPMFPAPHDTIILGVRSINVGPDGLIYEINGDPWQTEAYSFLTSYDISTGEIVKNIKLDIYHPRDIFFLQVPEPTTFGMLAMTAVLMASRRVRKNPLGTVIGCERLVLRRKGRC